MDIRGIIKRKDIEIVDATCTVGDAIAKMADRNVGSLIVRRTSPNEPYGIVTRQDVLFKVIAEGLDPDKVTVKDIMSSPVVILNNVDLDVRYAAKAMANAGVTNLVIFDGGDVYGFLSSTDIINAIRRELTIKSLSKKTEDVSGGC
ncbi:MAG: CBS domain-containing protein [Thermoplasmata archaeon]|nr:CBS domain-containing protein [Thermoplasmata archaeon]NIS12505.1 CBS domain-containing protein [Thermoplasmata archaeon]NIS20431.1 CBS domain-containing protein [Thermoplasmata archaeon]NIT77777.1 CBS domain-containing protein [Thermoplasmata archaeon]NIU49518.1 CBS domain-containing protein [Thermoplasmata archaeon]